MEINHNISAMITQGALYQVDQAMSKSLQKLSTGLRINTAADDAAGLGVSENLRTQVTGIQQASKNTQDAISLLNIADGALNEQANILQRMRELAIQGLNDTYSSTERSYMGQEFSALRDELDRIAASTNFNGMQIFAAPETTDGTPIYAAGAPNSDPPREARFESLVNPTDPLFSTDDLTSGNHFNFMIGANSANQDAAAFNNVYKAYNKTAVDMITVEFGQMDSNGLLSLNPNFSQASAIFDGFGWNPLGAGADLEDQRIAVGARNSGDVATVAQATIKNKLKLLVEVIDGSGDIPDAMKSRVFGNATSGKTFVTGLARVNEMRAKIGAMTNRLEHSINNSYNQMTNTQSAESLIRDVDFAQETATFTKNQILTESATAMLAQANSNSQSVLTLLK